MSRHFASDAQEILWNSLTFTQKFFRRHSVVWHLLRDESLSSRRPSSGAIGPRGGMVRPLFQQDSHRRLSSATPPPPPPHPPPPLPPPEQPPPFFLAGEGRPREERPLDIAGRAGDVTHSGATLSLAQHQSSSSPCRSPPSLKFTYPLLKFRHLDVFTCLSRN
jgi:hypothetical protein